MIIGACSLLCLLLALFVWININLNPVLIGLAASRVQAAAAQAMNDAILEHLSDVDYASLVNVRETGSQVYLLSANSGQLNLLAADCATSAQNRILELGEQGVKIPLGTVTGIPMLTGRGPKIRLSFLPAGAVKSAFESQFTSAGINQTLHRINLVLTATVRVILPGKSETLSVTATAPITENVIVGEVPGAYTNVANEEDLLNLIPGD